jgi:chromosomal replication initiator protein
VTDPPEPPVDAVWRDLHARLRETMSEHAYSTLFRQAQPLGLERDTLSIAVPNEFTREWISGNFLGVLTSAARESVGRDVRVDVSVQHTELPEPPLDTPARRSSDTQSTVTEPQATPPANPKYTFDNFVIGSSNRFAHAAALAVAEAPAQAYNPLFIYGGTGLGKTHLLQAIAAYASAHSSLTTCYVTSEAFMNDFINSLRDKRIEGFKQRYRTYDVLLVDDIQFLEGKERIQEEFFHTFNSLHGAGRQIVISSDRPPKEIATLEARLRSRFEWGLITDIQAPDLETRIAILRKRVTTDGLRIADEGVLTFIASRVSSNIRELEGALTRVIAFSSLTGLPPTTDLAEQVLRDLFPEGQRLEVTIPRIQQIVCDRFGIVHAELVGQKRVQTVTYPRQVAMYLCRELTDASLPKIGKEFGGRDHTTVIHATSKITRLIGADRSVYNLIQDLTATIKQGS